MDRTPINHAALRRLTLAQLLALAKSPEAPARSIRLYRAWDARSIREARYHGIDAPQLHARAAR